MKRFSRVRKKVFITSKCHLYSKAEAMQALEASLKALRTDYIDLWQIHQVGEMKEVEQIFGPGGLSKPSNRLRSKASAGSSDSPGIVIRRSTWKC